MCKKSFNRFGNTSGIPNVIAPLLKLLEIMSQMSHSKRKIIQLTSNHAHKKCNQMFLDFLVYNWGHVSIIFLTKKALEIFFAFQTELRDSHIIYCF